MPGGPSRGRLLRIEMGQEGPLLFSGISAYFSGNFEGPSKADLINVFSVGGGSVLQRRPISLAGRSVRERIPLAELDPQMEHQVMTTRGGSDDVAPRKRLLIFYYAASSARPSLEGRIDGEGREMRGMMPPQRAEAQSLAEEVGALAVPHTWLLDSAAKCELLLAAK
eukprot:TRINITY_DN4899_c0_g1_i1.p1 TRINITY_DN4899_c0_g1~~TRINITY_DN4899_c0_g1_i1.p1  ORF type:complete len:167 (+),score=33.30 TRINITY_DN4899_c0_g1_i1:317-817(+)